MQALDRKLWRELRQLWSQALTIALVVASGVAGFLATFSAWDALAWSRSTCYAESRFADVFSSLQRAPLSLLPRIAAISGVAQVQDGLAHGIQLFLPAVQDPIRGRLTAIDPQAPQHLNLVSLREGRWPSQTKNAGRLEVLLSAAFAQARGLRPGDTLQALMNGKLQGLMVSGIALSPEFVFAGLGGSPDVHGFGIVWMHRDAVAAAWDMHGAFNQVALALAPGASASAVIEALDTLLAPYGGAQAYGREDQLSHRMLDSEIREQQVLGTVLPGIFLLVAAFLLQTVMARHIGLQREQIATLKALGYDNRRIAAHYLRMVLAIIGLGCALGVLLGHALGQWFTTLYAQVFMFAQWHHRLRGDVLLFTLGLCLATGLLATAQAIRASVRLPPAEAMRPPAPGRYHRTWLEGTGLATWLSPGQRMVLRQLQRHPWRSTLGMLGVAASVAIVVSGSFWRDSIDLMLQNQFRQVLRGDVSLVLQQATTAQVATEALRLPGVSAVQASRSVAVQLRNGHRHWRGSLQGRSAPAELQRIVDVAQQHHEVSEDGLLLTDRLAHRLGLRVGETVQVQALEGERRLWRLPVAGVVPEMMGMNAYIARQRLNRLLREGDLVNQLTLAVDRGRELDLLQALQQRPRVAGAFSKAVMLRNVQGITARNLLIFSAVLTTFACVIAIGVVYNQTRIALAERAWELASLRVLGFTQGEVSALLLGEWLLASLVALPLGGWAGYGLSATLVRLIQTDEFFFAVHIRPATYAFASVCVVVAAVMSAWIVHRRIRHLDLVGVLKVRE
ncbi:MAG: ABC transporter permease [Limnohabitans sp.]